MSSTKFDKFFRSDHAQLIGFLRKVGFDREVAEDAAADAMLNAYKNWPQIDSPKSWVRRVAYRIACRQIQRTREAPRRAITGGWVSSVHLDPDVVQLKEEQELILRVLDELPDKQRLVMAWYLDGFNADEIAEHVDMHPATVRSHRRHAREKLKKAHQNTLIGPQHASSGEGKE